jgi:PKD repeat protein
MYTLVYSNSLTTCSVSVSTAVEVYDNPTVDVSNDGPACVGADVNLMSIVTNGTVYNWTGPDGYVSTEANPGLTAVGMTNSGTYELTVSDPATGCFATAGTILLVNENPLVNLGADIEVCDYVPVMLDAGSGFVYSWSTGDDTQTISPAVSDLYSVTITDLLTGCTATDEQLVTFSDSPVLTMSSSDESGSGMNDGTATVAIGGGVSPYSIFWNTGGDTETITGLAGGTYTVEVEDQNGCVSSSSVVVNTQNTPPLAEFSVDVTEGCDPVVVSFTDISANNPVSWNWTFGDGTVSSEQNPVHTFAGAGTYTVELLASNADGSDTYMLDIIVHGNPIVDLGEDVDACMGTQVTLNAGDGFISYAWTGGEDTQTLSLTENATYQVQVADEHGCTATDEINVIFHEIPVVDLGSDQYLCDGDSITLDAGAGFESYNWLSGETGQNLVVNQSGTYAVTVANVYGCEGEDEVLIAFNPLPVIDLPDTVACADEVFSFTLTDVYDEVFWPDGENDDTYTHTYTLPGVDTVLVTVGNAGCYTTDTLFIDVQICNAIEDLNAMNLSLYPNPTSRLLNVQIQSYQGDMSVFLVNIQGQVILEERLTCEGEMNHHIDMSGLVSGVYMLRVEMHDRVLTYKVVRR